MGDRAKNILEAVDRIGAAAGITAGKVSSLYESAAVDYLDQPDFLNAAMTAETLLKPEELLDAIQQIELDMGRIKTLDKGPRNIDIDLLLYDVVEVRLPDLQVPHPAMRKRSFVILPVLEIAPDALFPTGEPVRWTLKDLDISGIKKVSSLP